MSKVLLTAASVAVMFLASDRPIDGQTKDKPLRVGNGINPPARTKTVVPSYPRNASSGLVVLELVIDPQGHVDSLMVLRPVEGATDAAVAAVRQWEYTPTLLNGEPIWIILTQGVPSPWRDD